MKFSHQKTPNQLLLPWLSPPQSSQDLVIATRSPKINEGAHPYLHWIGLRENLQETMVFTIKYRGSCKFSLRPIQWYLDLLWTSGGFWINRWVTHQTQLGYRHIRHIIYRLYRLLLNISHNTMASYPDLDIFGFSHWISWDTSNKNHNFLTVTHRAIPERFQVLTGIFLITAFVGAFIWLLRKQVRSFRGAGWSCA